MFRVLFLFLPIFIFSNILKVGKNEKFKTIQSAVASSQSGDSILVENGHYKEGNINITKPLTIIGIGRPVLDGERERDDREPERDERDALHCSIPLKITLVVIFLARNPLSNTGIANSGSHSPQV